MNEFERAVIEAARTWRTAREEHRMPRATELLDALAALDEHERAQREAGISEGVAWRTVAVGDAVRGKSGTFFKVEKVQAIAGGKTLLTLRLPSGPHQITRPSESELTATVKRGPDGRAVQEFVNVFTSGSAGGGAL